MRLLRGVLPALVIVAWLAAAAVGGPYFGRIDEVASNDRASYLPASAEATRVAELEPRFAGSDDVPAIVVAARTGGPSDADLAWADRLAERIAALDGVGDGVSPAIPSDDGAAVEIVVAVAEDAAATVARITGLLDAAPDGIEAYVTGPAGFTADLVEGFRGIDGLLLLVALAAVLVILVIVYRSPLLPLIVLGTAVSALAASILLVWWLAHEGVVKINGQVQGILFILVIGAATDYALLYVARYREALAVHERRRDATVGALRGSLEPILASGLTVIAGLLCLLLSDLESNTALGPVAAIGIGFALLSALTLLPALLFVAGRVAFWPRRTPAPDGGDPERGLWAGVGRLVSRRPRAVWMLSTLLLGVLALGLVRLDAEGVAQSELVLGESQARTGQELLGEHFAAGSGSPALIVGREADADDLADAALAVAGVESVEPVTEPGPPGVPADPVVVDGLVMLRATLAEPADSAAAEAIVEDLREALDAVDPDAAVGGVSAISLDTDRTAIRDRTLIMPVVLAAILLILMLLLRAVVAPLLLIGSVILSFAAALGVSALAFEWLGFPGADPAVPLYAFVFLVALGVDYNIFLMTRVREEVAASGDASVGVVRGLRVTGGVITSAGIVLAATFAALSVIPILFLVQIAFIVAFGVLLDTMLVRSLLVPALAIDIGPAVWWPSGLWRRLRRGREGVPAP